MTTSSDTSMEDQAADNTDSTAAVDPGAAVEPVLDPLNSPGFSDSKRDNANQTGEPSGSESNRSQHLNSLPAGHQLRNWVVEKELGAGGFEITYLVRHNKDSDRLAVIREYLPIGIAVRGIDLDVELVLPTDQAIFDYGKERFLEQAQALARIDHINVVRTLDYFELGNTAYSVMDYVSGRSLQEAVDADGPLTDKALGELMPALLNGLEAIHVELLHHAIIPSNIMLRDDGFPVLIDIGAARESTRVRDMSDTDGPRLSIVYHSGYVPIEQIDGSENGPWTDLYSLGACFYFAAFADPPVDIAVRSEALQGIDGQPGRDLLVSPLRRGESDFSPDLLTAIEQSLRFSPERRPASVAEWRAHLRHAPTAEKLDVEIEQNRKRFEKTLKPKKSGRKWLIGSACVVLLSVAGWKMLLPPFLDRFHLGDTGTEILPKESIGTESVGERVADQDDPTAESDSVTTDAGQTDIDRRAEAEKAAAEKAAAEKAAAEKAAADKAEAEKAEAEKAAAEKAEAEKAAAEKAAAEKAAAEKAAAEKAAAEKAAADKQAAADRQAEEAKVAEQLRLAETQLEMDAKHQSAKLKLYEGIEKVEALAEASTLYEELLEMNPDDQQAKRGVEVLALLAEMRVGLTGRDVYQSLGALERIWPIWGEMGFIPEKLKPLSTQTTILEKEMAFIATTVDEQVLTDEKEVEVREILSELKVLDIAAPRLTAAENAVDRLTEFRSAIADRKFNQAVQLLPAAEKDLSTFAGEQVDLQTARNYGLAQKSLANLKDSEEFARDMEAANRRLAVRPIDESMIEKARQAFLALTAKRPDDELSNQVLKNLDQSDVILDALSREEIEKANEALTAITLLPNASSEELVLHGVLEKMVLMADVAASRSEIEDILSVSPLDEQRLSLAEKKLAPALDFDPQGPGVETTVRIIDSLRLVLENTGKGNFKEARNFLSNAEADLPDAGFSENTLINVSKQIDAAEQANIKTETQREVEERLAILRTEIEKDPVSREANKRNFAYTTEIMALDSGNEQLQVFLELIDHLNGVVEAREAGQQHDRALELLGLSKQKFAQLDMKVEVIDELMAEVVQEKELNDDIVITLLEESFLKIVQNNPLNREVLEEKAADNIAKIQSVREGDSFVIFGNELLAKLKSAIEEVENGDSAAAKVFVDEAAKALESQGQDPRLLDKAFEQLKTYENQE